MKKLSLLLIGLLLIPSLLLTSCDRGDDVVGPVAEPSFTTLKNYMVSNDFDLDKIDTNTAGEKFVVGAPADTDLAAFLAKYYIMDIRANDAYTAGHIEGAINVAFSDILTEGAKAEAAGKPALVVCYSGQTACYATSLMRMYGYTHTRALKWGMSGWNPTTAENVWDKRIGTNEAENHANWSFSAAPTNFTFDEPTIASYSTDGSVILKERVEQVVTDGFKTVGGSDVLASPGNYFINNYFSEADYSGFGHIANAYRINPLTLAGGQYLNLSPDANANIATYCYTGQTSAIVTAWLRVLGYDAYSLTYGVNGLYNTNPAFTSNQWGVDSKPKNLPLVK